MSGVKNGIRLCFNFNLAHGCALERKDVMAISVAAKSLLVREVRGASAVPLLANPD